jgi:hypothetical protein
MKAVLIALLLAASSTAFAQSVTTGSTAQQASTIANTVNMPSGGPITYGGEYTVKSAPTVYAPSPITPFSQASCIYEPTAAFSFLGFGFGGGVPIDGQTCNWRLSTQSTEATAAGYRDLAVAFKSVPSVGAVPAEPAVLLKKSETLMNIATDMQCLNSDRQRMVMEKEGLCAKVKDVATLDHRFNQPRSTQIDYSTE